MSGVHVKDFGKVAVLFGGTSAEREVLAGLPEQIKVFELNPNLPVAEVRRGIEHLKGIWGEDSPAG